MPLHQTLLIFIAAVLLLGVGSMFVERLRADGLRPLFWVFVLLAAAAISAASTAVGTTRHAGTGFTTSYGWPKPFYFHYLSETGERSSGWDFIYFAGNTLLFAGALLVLWTAWRLARR